MIYDLPELLKNGGYTYLWIHTSDKYLESELPSVLECEEVKSGYLYKIVYEEEYPVELEFVRKLK